MDKSDPEDTESVSGDNRSQIAVELERLRKATFSAVAKRERVPQPMFWSLFHGELKDIRKRKQQLQVLRDVFKVGE